MQHEVTCELTILMPCLNEEETIGICIDKARGFLDSRGIVGEIIVADNGSTDNSCIIAERHGARIVAVAGRGYGHALRGGIAAARGRFVIMGDADDSYDFTALDPFVEKLREGYDLVMGNRFKGGIKPGAMPVLNRYLGNPVLTAIGQLFFKSQIGDFHCGLRGFHRKAIISLGLETPGMEFASEMVVKATLNKLRICEVPTILYPDSRSGAPHLRRWRDGWGNLCFLLLFSPSWLFLYPGIALMLLGIVSMLWLLPGPRPIMGINFDVNTLVYSAAAIICGFQAMAFALFATVYAVNAKLLPENNLVTRVVDVLTLEIGISVGLILVIMGLVASVYAVGTWGEASYGRLDPVVSLRTVIPAATSIILGLQIIFDSFFLGLLRFKQSAVLSSTQDNTADSK